MTETQERLTSGEKGYIMEGIEVDFREFLYLQRRMCIGTVKWINQVVGIQPCCPHCGHELTDKDLFSHSKK